MKNLLRKKNDARGHALVLTDELLAKEVANGDVDVALALAAALNPTMFANTVDFHNPTNAADPYAVIRIRSSGKAYAIHFKTILMAAAKVYAETGERCEILQRAIPNKTPEYIR